MDSLIASPEVLHWMKGPEDVGALRRAVRRLALTLRATDAECARVELVATELGTNTLHHARPPGYLVLQPLAPPAPRGLELLAVDRGPGIADVRAVLDGPAGTGRRGSASREAHDARPLGLGCGLASVRRLASEFDVHSDPGRGTVVLARFFFELPEQRETRMSWGAVALPLAGELQNGDGWAVTLQATGCSLVLADGLGHGPGAARASTAAIELFHRQPELDLARYLADANLALRATRGAAVSVCRVLLEQRRLLFAGLGNVEGRLYRSDRSTGLAPRCGTLGMNANVPKMIVHELAWEPGSMLVLHSDGVRHPFDDAVPAALRAHDPALIAATLQRDLARGRDDATVLVLRDLRGLP
jgi:anti-sigma regulatory factor (Ser/Thr protein kinase)